MQLEKWVMGFSLAIDPINPVKDVASLTLCIAKRGFSDIQMEYAHDRIEVRASVIHPYVAGASETCEVTAEMLYGLDPIDIRLLEVWPVDALVPTDLSHVDKREDETPKPAEKVQDLKADLREFCYQLECGDLYAASLDIDINSAEGSTSAEYFRQEVVAWLKVRKMWIFP